jgi:hypothetical protein
MARKKAKKKIEEVAEQAGYPEAKDYLKRLADDADLRDSLGRAIETSQRAYGQLASKRKRAKLLEDEKFHHEVQEALDAFRNAAVGLAEASRKPAKKARRRGRKLMILVLGGGLALVGSEGLRSKVLDTLFGAEEEFEYSPPPPPPEAPQTPAEAPAAPEAAEPPAAPEADEPTPAPTETADAETAAEPSDGAA